MFWISNSNLTLTYTVDIYSHACHACCQLEACLPFRWPRPRLTSSHPGLEGIEELSLSLPCLPVKPQADLMVAVGSWLTAGRLPCGEGARVWVAWGISSLSDCSNPSRDAAKSSLCVLHVCLLFVCGQSCCSPSALCQTDGVHMCTLRMNMRGLQVCRNCTQVSCSQVCVCLKPRSALNISSRTGFFQRYALKMGLKLSFDHFSNQSLRHQSQNGTIASLQT